MSKVLVLYFSQSGDVRNMAEAVVRPLEGAPENFEIHWAEIQPVTPFPYPWRNVHKFFNVMPETVLNLPPDIRTPDFDPDMSFDLIILAYSVWFLSPSQPIQAFFKSEQARVLDGAPVITLTVSRKMWQRASEKMKVHLKQANAIHLDNIAVTHQGSGRVDLCDCAAAADHREGLKCAGVAGGRHPAGGSGATGGVGRSDRKSLASRQPRSGPVALGASAGTGHRT